MSQYREFQGKTLDEAIREACEYYGVPREKLEIDILSDAKSGIFGLVGVKKALIRAARVELGDTVSHLFDEVKHEEAPRKSERAVDDAKESRCGTATARDARPDGKTDRATSKTKLANGKEAGRQGRTSRQDQGPPGFSQGKRTPDSPEEGTGVTSAPADATMHEGRARGGQASAGISHGKSKRSEAAESHVARQEGRKDRTGRKSLPKPPAIVPERMDTGRKGADAGFSEVSPEVSLADDIDPLDGMFAGAPGDSGRDDLPEFSLETCDRDHLFDVVRTVVLRLVSPIVGEVPCEVVINGRRVRVTLNCGDASGLLVGRDGQTLAAVQYLASRIVSRQLGGAVRLQIDAGKYRERQDDKLREIALALARKVKESRRSQSTRPLSAYQRRLVHLALEHDPELLTRSKGEGAQRRVVIYLNRGRDTALEVDKDPPQSAAPSSDADEHGMTLPMHEGNAPKDERAEAHDGTLPAEPPVVAEHSEHAENETAGRLSAVDEV